MHSILERHLEDYLDGCLAQPARGELEAHLAGCAACRETVNDIRQCSGLLQTLAVDAADPAPVPAPGFYVKVRQSIEASQAAQPWWDLLPAFRQLVTAALMFVLLVGGYAFAVRATETSATAELLLDARVEREAPAVISAHAHTNPGEMCRQCWEQNRRPRMADPSLQRELTLAAVVAGD